jgi:hypothetical protein
MVQNDIQTVAEVLYLPIMVGRDGKIICVKCTSQQLRNIEQPGPFCCFVTCLHAVLGAGDAVEEVCGGWALIQIDIGHSGGPQLSS